MTFLYSIIDGSAKAQEEGTEFVCRLEARSQTEANLLARRYGDCCYAVAI
jgi:hypothetical protein